MPKPDRRFRRYDPDQSSLMPHDLRDWLPKDHMAFFMRDVMERIDLSKFYAYYDNDGRGCVPYDPRMMVTIILYAYASGINSAREMARMLYSDVAFRYLAAGNYPDHETINGFRNRHEDELRGMLQETVRLAREAGLARMGIVALDGTKFKANASLAANRDRDGIDERIRREFDEYLKEAAEVDRRENEEFGAGGDGFTVPPGFVGKEQLRRRLDEAKRQIEAEDAKLRKEEEEKAAARKEKEEEAAAKGKKVRGRKPKRPESKKIVRNTTDPDSRVMKTPKGFEQAYNAQFIVDCESHIILEVDTVQDCNDKRQMVPMLDRLTKEHGRPIAITDDAGYFSVPALKAALARGVMVFMPSKNRHKAKGVVREGPPPQGLSEAEQMEWTMATAVGREIYKMRCSTAEPCIGTIKWAMGFRQYVLRGLEKVRMETRLMASGRNIRRLNTVRNERRRRGEALFPSEMRGRASS
jgi:transposase